MTVTADEITLQRHCDDYVRQNVNCCLSSLVATLAQGYGQVPALPHAAAPLNELTEQAAELASPVEDYEEAARQAGWDCHPLHGWRKQSDTGYDYAAGPEDACFGSQVEPYQWEVYEHWAISNEMADDLERHGEKVDRDFAGLTVWARTTTGQAISMDHVIREIVREIHKDSPAS